MKHHLSDLPRDCGAFLRTRVPALLILALLSSPSMAATFEDAEAALRRGDYAAAIPLYTALAEAGDAQAMTRLGRFHQKGEGVARDLPRAISYYTEAAARGNADAQFNLGNLYLLGEGVPQDDDWAFTYYRQAAQQGHVLAQKNVNEFYRAAGITPPSMSPGAPVAPPATSPGAPTAPADDAAPGADATVGEVPAEYSEDELRAIEMARSMGIQVELAPGAVTTPPPAQNTVPPPAPAAGLTEIKRRLAAGETTEVKGDLEILADAGNVEAQFLLSRLLITLQPRTDGEAMLWLKQAAQGGLAEAQYALAEAYRRGEGMPPDEAEAVTWYRIAARRGHAGARQQLNALYREAGLPIPKIYAEPPAGSAVSPR